MTSNSRKRALAIVVGLMSTQAAVAGEFSVNCSYKNENLRKCATALADIVTDKFVSKFPSSRFQIFVHSSVVGFSNGGYGAYAVAGVIPAQSGDFPVRRFSSTNINGANIQFNQIELAKIELETFRAAVRNLMEQCEISPNCDVYVP